MMERLKTGMTIENFQHKVRASFHGAMAYQETTWQ